MDPELLNRIRYVLINCRKLIKSTFKQDFPTSGNIGIFSQSEQEYIKFKRITEDLVNKSTNPNQKYFELNEQLILKDGDYIATFTHIYIRKFDPSEYGKNKGDIDFIVDDKEYSKLKDEVSKNKYQGAEMYQRPGWDTIQITEKNIDVVSYLSTREMAEKVRVKFDNLTNL